jgi:molybdenum ABC transporter molybdate-binding protein
MTRRYHIRTGGATNLLVLLVVTSIILVAGLFAMLLWVTQIPTTPGRQNIDGDPNALTVFCAAGLRYPVDQIAADYTATYGTPIQLQYGGSNTMLSQLEVGQNADLYIAADESYTQIAQAKGIVRERLPIATQRPVIVINKNSKQDIKTVADLYRNKTRYAIGDPHATAIGAKTKKALTPSGEWPALLHGATVLKPTVNEIASAVALGSIDAGIVWDSTAAQYNGLRVVHDPLLERDLAHIEIAVTDYTQHPTSALQFARYVTAADRGLNIFSQRGFDVIAGDSWFDKPHLTFFVGAVNRRAVENAVRAFEAREGVSVNTVYNGCGILTAQMRALHDNSSVDFPDSFMACDTYYMDTVGDLFMESVNVSDTDIVLVVKKGNPKSIRQLSDLLLPGIRVAIGHPRQCTIGALSQKLLADAGLQAILSQSGNIVTETTSSALLLPNVVTGAADVAIAYRADADAVGSDVDVIAINSADAKAIQPFGISKQSSVKRLSSRLFDSISQAKADFLKHGFGWQLAEGARPSITEARSTESESVGNNSPSN